MPDDAGWARLYRRLLSHPIWTQLQPAVGKVAVTFILLANYRASKWYDGNSEVELPPGSFVTSYDRIAERCNISRQQARDAFDHLEKLDFGTYRRTQRYTVVTLCNWETYQGSESDENTLETTLRTPKEHPENTLRTPVKELKNLRREEVHTESRSSNAWRSEAFTRFWEVVWYKVGKDAAHRKFEKAAKSPEIAEAIIAAAREHGPRLIAEARGERSPLHPATWLHQGRWKDEPMLPGLVPRGRDATLTFGERKDQRRDEIFADLMTERAHGQIHKA